MDLSPSEASSPFTHNEAGKCLNNQPLIDPISNDPKPQFYQSQPSKVSDQGKGRGRRPILSAFEKKERKREFDRNYRERRKSMVKNLTAENSTLKTEYERLTEEIRQLKEDIKWLYPSRQLADQELKKVERYFYQESNLQDDNKSVSVQGMVSKTDKGEYARRGAKRGCSINNWIKLFDKGMTSDGKRQLQCSQGKGAQVSKLKTPSLEVFEMHPKRRRDVDASPSTKPALATMVTAAKSITLSVELLETDSAFDNASVAHKISASFLPPADKKRTNVPSSVNIRNSMHHAWLAVAHAVKAEEQTKQMEHECNKYHKKTITLDRDFKKAKLEAKGFQLEVEHLKGELAKSKEKENEAMRQANHEYIVRRAFMLCINEVQHIYPNLDLSMISVDELKTVKEDDDDGSDDGNSEGENTTNAKVTIVETEAGNNDHDHHG